MPTGSLPRDHAAAVSERICGPVLRQCRGQNKCKCHQRVSEAAVTEAVQEMQIYARQALAQRAMEQEKQVMSQELAQTQTMEQQAFVERQNVASMQEATRREEEEGMEYLLVALVLGVALLISLVGSTRSVARDGAGRDGMGGDGTRWNQNVGVGGGPP